MLLLVFVEATHGNSGVCDSHEKKRQKKVNSTSEVFHSGREGHMLKVQFMEESTCLTSDYTTKPQSSRQCGIGTKTDI